MLTHLLCAVTVALAPPSPLPLTTVRLYETGMGQFERRGPLDHGATIPLPVGHLDDALKTLTVTGPGPIPTLHFPSRLSPGMARAFANLPAHANALDFDTLLHSLKGSTVTVRTATEHEVGRVVDVVEETRWVKLAKAGQEEATLREAPVTVVLLLTRAGELRRLAAGDLKDIRPMDPAQLAHLHGALDALTLGGMLALNLAPAPGVVTATYVAEVPVWRATWRVQLQGGSARLTGLALIHNDTAENWSTIRVELLSGRPTSFVYPLATPRYAQRELVTPQEDLSTVAQLQGTTPDALWGDDFDTVTLGSRGRGAGGGGVAIHAGQTVFKKRTLELAEETEDPTPDPPMPDSTLGGSPLFTYALASALTLSSHESALVPFVDATVEASQVILLPENGGVARAVVRLKNTTGQTLPQGPLTFHDVGAFGGEAVLPRTANLQVQWLDVAPMQDVEATVFRRAPITIFHCVQKRQGAIRALGVYSVTTLWTVENRSGATQRVHLTLPATGKISGVTQEESMGVLRAGVIAAPAGVSRHAITQTLQVTQDMQLANLTAGELDRLALTAAEGKVLTRAAAVALQQEKARAQESAAGKDLEEAKEDVLRLREDLKSAPTDKNLVARVLTAQDRYAATRASQKRAAAAVEASTQELILALDPLPLLDRP